MALKWLTTEQPGDDGLPASKRLPALCSVLLGTLLVVLDSSIINIALPEMGQALHVPASSSIWISNIYQLVAASLILSFAALADRIGSKRLYVAGLSLFVLASLACALSTSFIMLVIARAIQGVGGAAVMSLGPSLNRRIFPTRILGSAIGLVAMTVAAALAAGPTLGGMILAIAHWPWLFLINVPVGGVGVWMAIKALPDERGHQKAFDYLGAVLSVITLACSVFGLGHLQRGSHHALAMVCLIIAVVAGGAFLYRQKHVATPLLPLSMFNEIRFTLAALTSFFSFVAQTMVLLALPFLLQSEQGYSPMMAGLLFTAWPVVLFFTAPRAGRLADKMSPTVVSSIGLFLFMLGLLSVALLSSMHTVTPLDVIWRSALCGLGFGLYQAPNNRELMGSLPRKLSSRASGVQATVRTFAQSVGAALVALAFSGIVGTSFVKGSVDIKAGSGMSGASDITAGGALPVNVALWWAFGMVLVALLLGVGRMTYLHVCTPSAMKR
ncbi:Riboflavin transporter RibZ [Halomonadaceae bacterium LMG 33818]|uniref:MFS transporter n=1 Tax=Cernens ardua TaxID=3402176 RepID=UPI003EDBD46B